MPKVSSGLLMFKINNGLEVFLAHPGGPFWEKKDESSWTIPKGEVNENEDLFEAAKREFEEEIGMKPEGDFIPLDSVEQKSGKIVHAWAFRNDSTPVLLRQNFITIDFKGKKIKIPEIDKAQFFSINEAKKKILPAQKKFLEKLEELVD
ncbi:NUDIX domain-containing protein [Candidatus Pacearchaeota archaeon]|nr:NUDIX domain-containing protein [Candidatus Pacearchaeota archaeon]